MINTRKNKFTPFHLTSINFFLLIILRLITHIDLSQDSANPLIKTVLNSIQYFSRYMRTWKKRLLFYKTQIFNFSGGFTKNFFYLDLWGSVLNNYPKFYGDWMNSVTMLKKTNEHTLSFIYTWINATRKITSNCKFWM